MKKVKFLDIPIGGLFISNNRLWVRTSREGATNKSKFGTCNFTIDPEDEYVEPVDFEEVEQYILKNKG